MFSYSLFPRDSMWESGVNGGARRMDSSSTLHPFRQFIIPPGTVSPFGDLTFAKVYEEHKKIGSSITVSHLAAVQHVYGDVWSLYKLDKGTRMRDIRAINTSSVKNNGEGPVTTSTPISYHNPSVPIEPTNPDWNISNLLVTPTWHDFHENHIDAIMNIDMTAPSPSDNLRKSSLSSAAEVVDPLSVLNEKYNEILYSTNIPLVYFAKSTLSRIRSIFRESTEHGSGNDKNMVLVDILSKKVIQINQLDEKYEIATSTRSGSESENFNKWIQNVKKEALDNQDIVQEQISLLKLREIQLQIILLLEILAHNGDKEYDLQSIPSLPTQTLSPSPPPPAPNIAPRKNIVRKKKKPVLKKINSTVGLSEPSPPSFPINTSLSPDVSIDILFDRLCINEAISGQVVESHKLDRAHKTDKVQEFCLEIILPFFASRLPDKTKQMLKKARGLSTRSSKRTKRVLQKESTVTSPAPRLSRSISLPTSDTTNNMDINVDRQASMVSSNDPSLDQENLVPSVLIDASKSHSQRGGFLSTKNNQQKRQVEMSFAVKKQQKDSIIANELAFAIKNISKPNRLSVAEELAQSKPAVNQKAIKSNRRRTYTTTSKPITAESTSVLQVPGYGVLATPAKKRSITLPEFRPPNSDKIIMSTPQKRQKLSLNDETITSSPSFIASTPSTTRRTLDFNPMSPDVVLSTPSKVRPPSSPFLPGPYDTDDDMMHID